jgi:putative endonuclease
MSSKTALGKQGELLASQFLEQKGYTIVATNWHCRYGEVDIIACLDNVWAFVEVKTRRSDQTEDAFVNITPQKQQKFIKTVQAYSSQNNLDDINWRIDAIAVIIPRTGQPIIEHVEDAFDW